MASRAADVGMIVIGVTSAVLLVVYGMLAAGGSAETDPVFWILVLAFLVYIGWDIRRHLRAMRSRSGARGGRNL